MAVHRLDSSQVSKRWTGCVEVASSYSGTKTFADYSLTTDLVFSHLLEFSWNPIIWFSDGPQYGFRDAGFALCEGRDSGLKVCTECEMPKICIAIWRDCAKIWFGMTGLENPIGDPPPGRSRQRTLPYSFIRKLKQRRQRRQREWQKSNRFRLAKQQFCTCITLFFLPSLHNYDVESG